MSPDGRREQNQQRVVRALRGSGSASRSELVRLTGLSRTTVVRIVEDLQQRRLILEEFGDCPAAGRGRPAATLRLDPSAGIAVGVDFGHERLRVGVADLSSRVLAERTLELDVDQAATAALDAAAELVDEALSEATVDRARVIGVGMGVPAPLNRVKGSVGSTVILPHWRELDLAGELSRRLSLAVEIENDANLGVLAEASFGAARGLADVAYVQISGGIGAGLLLAGRLYRGATGAAGEIGHIQVLSDGVVCRCGKRGCLETIATSQALVSLMRPTYGQEFTLSDLLRLASEGDPAATRLINGAGRAVGRVVADLTNNLDLAMIVVGGDLSPAGEPLIDGIRESIEHFAMPGVGQANVTTTLLGDRAEMLGALTLVIKDTKGPWLVGLDADLNEGPPAQPGMPLRAREAQGSR